MLNESELEIVKKLRIHSFGVYLHKCWSDHEIIVAEIQKGNLPESQGLEKMVNQMQRYKTEFDIVYLVELPGAQVNPLKEEQKAWQKLSPDVGKFLNGFKIYTRNYSQESLQEEDKLQLQTYLDIWWAFLQEWNAISKSYGPKIEEVYRHLNRKGITTISARETRFKS